VKTRDDVFRRFSVTQSWAPRYVVWELTLACDQPCTHCGSRAGTAREGELSTLEALELARQLAELGCFECALIGGEAYLHAGFLDVVRELKRLGVRPTMTTGGRGVGEALAQQMAAAGLYSVSVSLDGLEPTHDLMRASRGSFAAATAALGHLKAAGVRISANTNFNRLNEADLEPLFEHLASLGISAWQVQVTTPLGRAADRPAMLFQPWDLLSFMPRLAEVKRQAFARGISVQSGNNLGYFGPEEATLRSPAPGMSDHFQGCQAGRQLMGIEANGAVKGCPSLQTSHYVGGNVRDTPLAALWAEAPELAFTRQRTVDDLWGFCRTCPFAATCLGGCSFTAHALLGKPGNNPLCHYRAGAFAKQGLRERLVPTRPAPGKPFDCAEYQVVMEPLDAPDPRPPTPRDLVKRRAV
jgi:radical SAM protein with 4Fe4S-binding SPASM domain